MIDVEFHGTGITTSLPENWSEMSARQIRRVFRLNDHCSRKGRGPAQFRILMLYQLLGIRPSWKTSLLLKGEEGQQLAENVTILCDKCLANFFRKDESGVPHLVFDDIRNSLPVIRRGATRRPLVGPADLLQDLSFGEFRHASDALNSFFQSANLTDLDECVAILYRIRSRKANRAGRKVVGMDPARDIARVIRIPSWKKNLVLMWFSACLQFLQTQTLRIDGEDVPLQQLFAGEGNGPSQYASTWSDLLLQIAKDGALGPADRVDEEPLFSILKIMWCNYKEAKRYEKIAKTHKA